MTPLPELWARVCLLPPGQQFDELLQGPWAVDNVDGECQLRFWYTRTDLVGRAIELTSPFIHVEQFQDDDQFEVPPDASVAVRYDTLAGYAEPLMFVWVLKELIKEADGDVSNC